MPLSSLVGNLAILSAFMLAYLALLAFGIIVTRRAGQISGSQGQGILIATAIGLCLFAAATIAADALGATMRMDLVIGSLSAEQASSVRLAVRFGLIALYVLVIAAGSLLARSPLAPLRGRTRNWVVIPISMVLFILVTLPLTDLLHSCYLQSTVALASRC